MSIHKDNAIFFNLKELTNIHVEYLYKIEDESKSFETLVLP